jgi:hypothetical protein
VSGLLLAAPAPNPLRGSALLRFTLPTASRARLQVFDPAGRRVTTLVDRDLAAGPHAFAFAPAAGMAPGVYLLRLDTALAAASCKLVVLR